MCYFTGINRLAIRMAVLLAVVITSIFSSNSVNAQELNCVVEVNADQIEGTNRTVFESLRESMTEYINSRKWTNAQFAANEKIECRIYLTVKSYEDDLIKGDLQVQVSRPVYNTNYTTTLLNFKDSKVEFQYRDGDPLIYNETTMESNLTAILNYYVYLFLAMDFDSFSPLGGQPYFDRANTIVQQAQSSGEIGWKTFEDSKNRSAVLQSFTDAGGAMRDLYYNYHRKGLDEMATSPDKGRATITETLKNLDKLYQIAPMSVGLSMFRDAKLDELVNLYSQAPQNERDEAYEILSKLYPTDTERLAKIKNPDPY